jgi:NADH-quinone oxidoreductase subunit A
MLQEYLPVLLQIVVAVGFAAAVLIVSVIVGKSGRRTRVKDMAYECGMVPQGEAQPRFSVRFYLVAMLFILFDLEIVFMYPWAVVYKETIKDSTLILWSMLSFISILMVGYVYALKKARSTGKNNARSTSPVTGRFTLARFAGTA